jgi:mono/diheme cytochrome c family protein
MKRTLALIAFAMMAAGCGTYAASNSTSVPREQATVTELPTLRPAATTPPPAMPTPQPVEDPAGDASAGETIFHEGKGSAPACVNCHAAEPGPFALGPVMTGISERAGSRVEGMSAADYLHQSILNPGDYIVPGFRPVMPPTYGENLTEQDIEDIIAYLMTR